MKVLFYTKEFETKLTQFLAYLSNKRNYVDPKRMEIVVEKTTNEWEILRYSTYYVQHAQNERPQKVKSSTNICYKNKDGKLTFTGQFQTHWQAFLSNAKLSNPQAPSKEEVLHLHSKKNWLSETKHRKILRSQLLERDGNCCFYCGLPLEEDATLEHVLPKMFGGSDDINNLVLTHQKCNQKADTLNMHEKIKLRDATHIQFQTLNQNKLTIRKKCLYNTVKEKLFLLKNYVCCIFTS